MQFELKRADRSWNNESEAKDVFGAITEKGSNIVICYVPNQRMADAVLNALNGVLLISRCDFLGDFTNLLDEQRIQDAIQSCQASINALRN